MSKKYLDASYIILITFGLNLTSSEEYTSIRPSYLEIFIH